jgi:hypothetical protein
MFQLKHSLANLAQINDQPQNGAYQADLFAFGAEYTSRIRLAMRAGAFSRDCCCGLRR